MNWTWRPALPLAAAAMLLGPMASVHAAGDAGKARGQLVYLGMHGSQLRAARFDPRNGTLTDIGTVAENGRPTWAVAHPRLPILYVTDEAGNDGQSNGHVLTYRIDRVTGALSLIGTADAGGGGTTFLSLDARSMTLVAANYGGGSLASFPVAADGTLGLRASLVQDHGTGPHRRQKSPHAHAAMVAPGGRAVLVADLGADRVFAYPFDPARHQARAAQPGEVGDYVAPPGSGPRHMAASRDGRFIYLLDELNGDLVTLRWDAASRRLTPLDEQPTRSPDFTGDSSASELAVSKDGRFLYVGNRSESLLMVYALDKATGKASVRQRIASGGKVPWHFTLSPDGRWMLVANEASDRIDVFAVDPRSGRLTATDKTLSTPKPVSITFAP